MNRKLLILSLLCFAGCAKESAEKPSPVIWDEIVHCEWIEDQPKNCQLRPGHSLDDVMKAWKDDLRRAKHEADERVKQEYFSR